MRPRYVSAVVLFMVLATGTSVYAQAQYEYNADAQTGRPTWGSFFEGGLDTINLYNGNVMFDIPILSQPGRELQTDLRFTYNSQNWEAPYYPGSPYGIYTGGWRQHDAIGERPYYYVTNTACWQNEPGYAQEEWQVSAWWIDGFGTKHRYLTTLYTESEECYTSGPPSTDNLTLLGTDGLSYDGSVLWTGASMYEMVIRFPNGTVIEFTENPTIRTPNGNYWTRAGNGLPIQDTLGRVIGFETNKGQANPWYKRYTVLAADGTQQVYQVNYEDGHSVWRPTYYYAGWTTINNWLLSIDLPGDQHYIFEYNHPQGFLTNVTLPTGATISYTYLGDPWVVRGDFVGTRTLNDGVTSRTWQFSRSTEVPGIAKDVTVIYPEGNRVVHRFNTYGQEYETRWEEAGGAQRRRVTTTWFGSSPNVVTAIQDNAQRQTTYSYTSSQYCYCSSVLSQVEETDWGYGAPGPVMSRTNYYWSWPSEPYQQLSGVELYGVNPENPNGLELQGKTEYYYDQSGLWATSGVPNKGAPGPVRGNLTTLRQYTSGSSVVEDHYEYDDLGNRVRHLDPLLHPTNFSYADNFSDGNNGRNTFAYLTQVTNAVNQAASSVYHFQTGLVTRTTDPRNLPTVYEYDALNRPFRTTLPNSLIQTWNYDSAQLKVTASTNLGSVTETFVDKFSRVIKTLDVDPVGNLQVDTEYDGNGRVKRVSQPYRIGTPAWNTSYYDALDRLIQATGPDGNPLSQNSYWANTRNDGSRGYVYDGLGRLAQVTDSATTTYLYYAFGQLYGVAGQGRNFTYNWLGQMTSATNPESGTVNYQYDAAGRVATRSDQRGVTASYGYDVIDRPTDINYSGGSVTTPPVSYIYDQNGFTGLLTTMQDGVGTHSYAYNAAGQITSEQMVFAGVSGTFTASYVYDNEGNLSHATYPSGRIVDYTYQPGTGLLSAAQDQTTGATLLSNITRNGVGLVTQRTLGNGVVQNQTFNGLLQVENMSASQGPASLMNLNYSYAGNHIQTRSDALQPEHSVQYGYDSSKRLESVTGTATDWGITWQFDASGNRTHQTPTGIAADRVGPQLFGYGPNNHVVNPSGWDYDEAGNLTHDGTHHYYYDAESQLIQVDSSGIQYAYDGQGRRARKTVTGSTTVTTYYFYGQLGLMSEFSTSSELANATTARSTDRLQYRLNESTGTALLLTDGAGSVRENNRVLPYGEPWLTFSPNLSANDQKFTNYHHDNESDLDYATARHYSSRSGRFTTPDPGALGADVGDPRSWNAYVYGLNDPINGFDPDGLATYRVTTELECPINGKITAVYIGYMIWLSEAYGGTSGVDFSIYDAWINGFDCEVPDNDNGEVGQTDQAGNAGGGGGIADLERGRNSLWDAFLRGKMGRKKCLKLFAKLPPSAVWANTGFGPFQLLLTAQRANIVDGLLDQSLYADLWRNTSPQAWAVQQRTFGQTTVAAHLALPGQVAAAELSGTKIAVNLTRINTAVKDNAALVGHESFHNAGWSDQDIQQAWFGKVNLVDTSNIGRKFKGSCL